MIRSINRSVFLLPILIIICECGSKPSEPMNSIITVTGLAQNGKGGALLVADDTTVYYLEGMDAWETSLIGKRIEVTGTLKVETLNEGELKNEQGEYTQGMAGEKRILVNAKWKLHQE
jgi:hypothetical protein